MAIVGITALSVSGPYMSFWEGFYFACFIAGLLLSLVSLVGGMGHGSLTHVSWHFHPPHVPGAARMPHGAMAKGGVQASPQGPLTVPWWNAFSIMVFLCWFGAAGYLMTRYGSLVTSVVFLLAVLCGFVGGALIFWFLTRILLPHERELTAEDTAVEGAVGRVSSVIRDGGTGEVLYEQMGARRSVPARSESGGTIALDEEVFVMRYEDGIAYVRRWEELPARQESL